MSSAPHSDATIGCVLVISTLLLLNFWFALLFIQSLNQY
uniref:Uncharacterized protein n=1 Tax=Ciona intestinalis TaxID=7719 RepID=H2XT88_CIOIN